MEKKIDRELTLNYLDKIHSVLMETGKSLNRIVLFVTLLSITVISLSINIVSVKQDFSLLGLEFQLPSWFILLGGAWIIGALFIYFLGLFQHHTNLLEKVLEIYIRLGFVDEDMLDLNTNSLEPPIVLAMLSNPRRFGHSRFDRVIYTLSVVVSVVIWLLLPIIAQIFAYYKIVTIFGLTWWVAISIFLFFILAVGYSINTYKRNFIDNNVSRVIRNHRSAFLSQSDIS